MKVQPIELRADGTTPEAIAGYLRFVGRISDRVVDEFTWEGDRYDSLNSPFKANG